MKSQICEKFNVFLNPKDVDFTDTLNSELLIQHPPFST